MAAKHLLKLPAKHKFKDIKGPIPYHVLPGLDDTYDLGAAAQRWRDLFISRYLKLGILASDLIPDGDANRNLGAELKTFYRLWVQEICHPLPTTIGVHVAANLCPSISGLFYLGMQAEQWTSLWAGSVYATTRLFLPKLASDPFLQEGLLWLRTDLDRLKYSPDGLTAKTIPLILDDIQDVEAPSPSDGQVLTYEAATSLWKAKSPGAAVAEYYMLMAEEVKEDSATYNLAKASWNSAHCHWSYCAVKDFFDGTWKVALNACLTAPMPGEFVSAVIYYWNGSSWAELGSEISHSNGTAVKEGDFVTIPSNCKLLAMYTSSTEAYGYIRGASYHFKKA